MTKKQTEQEIRSLRRDLDTVIKYLTLHELDYRYDKSIHKMLWNEKLACCQPGLLDTEGHSSRDEK